MLGKNIKEFRLEKGLSQAQLAALIGVSQGAIYFWEKGINEPTAGYLIKLARVFSVSVDELLSFDNGAVASKEKYFGEFANVISKLSVDQRDVLMKTALEFLKNK